MVRVSATDGPQHDLDRRSLPGRGAQREDALDRSGARAHVLQPLAGARVVVSIPEPSSETLHDAAAAALRRSRPPRSVPRRASARSRGLPGRSGTPRSPRRARASPPGRSPSPRRAHRRRRGSRRSASARRRTVPSPAADESASTANCASCCAAVVASLSRGRICSSSAPDSSMLTCVESAKRYCARPSWMSRATRARSSATARPNSAWPIARQTPTRRTAKARSRSRSLGST